MKNITYSNLELAKRIHKSACVVAKQEELLHDKLKNSTNEIVDALNTIKDDVDNIQKSIVNVDNKIGGSSFKTNITVGGLVEGSVINSSDDIQSVLRKILYRKEYASIKKLPHCVLTPNRITAEIGSYVDSNYYFNNPEKPEALQYYDGEFYSYEVQNDNNEETIGDEKGNDVVDLHAVYAWCYDNYTGGKAEVGTEENPEDPKYPVTNGNIIKRWFYKKGDYQCPMHWDYDDKYQIDNPKNYPYPTVDGIDHKDYPSHYYDPYTEDIYVDCYRIVVKGVCDYGESEYVPKNSDGSTETKEGEPKLVIPQGSCVDYCIITGLHKYYCSAVDAVPTPQDYRDAFDHSNNCDFIEPDKEFFLKYQPMNDKKIMVLIIPDYLMVKHARVDQTGEEITNNLKIENIKVASANKSGDGIDYKQYIFSNVRPSSNTVSFLIVPQK